MKSLSSKRYLAVVLSLSILTAAGLVTFNYWSCFEGNLFSFAILREYQYGKLEKPGDAELIFLGDSSLGCGIDPLYLEELSGRPTLKLALNGMYGFAGPYNLLCQAIETQKPKTIVMMATPGMMLSPPSWEGYVYSSQDVMTSFARLPRYSGTILKTWLDILLNVKRIPAAYRILRGNSSEVTWQNDYFAPKIKQGDLGEPSIFVLGKLEEENLLFLNEMRDLCKRSNIRLIFAFSPIPKTLALKYGNVLDVQTKYLTSMNIPVIPPFLAERDELADTAFHARPDAIRKVTLYYKSQLEGFSD